MDGVRRPQVSTVGLTKALANIGLNRSWLCVENLFVKVRPEDLTVAGAADLDHPCFDAVKIEVVKQLGSEILLDMKVGESVMVASVEPTVRVKVQDKLRFAMRPSRLHVFDAKTEAAI